MIMSFKKKNIGVSLLWSPIRKSRVKALIKLRIFSEHLLGNNLKLQANLEHYFLNFKHFFKNSSTI